MLKRAMKYASQCMEDSDKISLYIEVLNKMLYVHTNGGDEDIDKDIIQKLLETIKEELKDLSDDQDGMDDAQLQKLNEIKSYFRNTVPKLEQGSFAPIIPACTDLEASQGL